MLYIVIFQDVRACEKFDIYMYNYMYCIYRKSIYSNLIIKKNHKIEILKKNDIIKKIYKDKH